MRFGAFVVMSALGCAALSANAGLPVVTESGPLTGTVSTDGKVNEYLGIPYAAPPVGPLRWMPPQPFGAWTGTLAATTYARPCPQQSPASPTGSIGVEDCLHLNVFVPNFTTTDREDESGLAVMVWVHGGGLVRGDASDYDPTPLVEQGGVIVVTLDYRLGLLGFFAHPALDREEHLAGNYGLMDQQAALAWVKRNIAAFGGNPARTTVFGESAGGLSVYSQIASPLAAGLFERAIAQSGAYASFADYLERVVPLATAESTSTPASPSGLDIAAALGCPDPATAAPCLRNPALTPAEIVTDDPPGVFPFIDGSLLTQSLHSAYSSGNFNRVPVMTGTNHDEYRYFVATNFDVDLGTPLVNTCPSASPCYPAALAKEYWSLSAAQFALVLAEYPVTASSAADAGSLALGAAGTDGTFACTAERAMQGLASHVLTFAYEFNDENAPVPRQPGYSTVSFPMGAYHSADVQYLFNLGGTPAPFTKGQAALSRAMIAYWTNFAKRSDPNAAGLALWIPYFPFADLRQSLVPPRPHIEFGFTTDHMCGQLWDRF
ncbi:MAG TPA: carboxylesterase family protein [Casimicrobiaceae bacterium]|nr:carboxylesterase family protein [Casimicrobiaceae bacterium]